MSAYADGITAYSFVQGVGLFLLTGQNRVLACNVYDRWWVAELVLLLATIVYWCLVRSCYRRQIELMDRGSAKVLEGIAAVQTVRLWVVICMGIAELVYVASIRYYPLYDRAKCAVC